MPLLHHEDDEMANVITAFALKVVLGVSWVMIHSVEG